MAELEVKIKTTLDKQSISKARAELGGLARAPKIVQAKKSFDDLDKSVKKVGKSAKKSKNNISSIGSEVFDKLGPAALASPAAAIAALAAGMGLLALSTLKAAEESKKVTSAFVNLSGGAQIATANLQAMRNATRGLISETEQMQIANQLLGMNIVGTADQLEEVVGVSRRLGKEFKGLGAKDAAEEFAIMIANMSVARLDSFGLSSGRVRKRINELRKETEGMTREAAFFQATMEEGQKTLERLGPEIITTAEETSRMAAEWANLRVEMGRAAEGTGILKGLAAGVADNLVLLRDWSVAGTDVNAKQQALEIQIKRTQATIENNTSGWFTNISAAEKNREKLKELQTEYARLTNRIEVNTQAAKNQQEALQAAIRGEEIAAENLAKREASEKKFLDTQKQFAKDVIGIQSDTQDQLTGSQETFDDSSVDAAEDHAKRLLKIKEKAAKSETNTAKKLQKDLSKIDTNLKKAIIKSELGEGKKIAKAQANFAKQDKTERRKKQIDALGDERLFQFELRNLAADGEGIAIKEALERRAIEQQIASEKAEFEKDVESDKRKDQVESIKQEGTDRRAELRQQASERKADLQERNEEAAAERAERLNEEILQENEAFGQKKADLREALQDRDEAIKEGERERIAEIAKGLAETEELTNAQLDRMIELAKQFGPKFGEVFADGMTKAFSENLKIAASIESANETIGASVGGLPIAQGINGNGVAQTNRGLQPFQTGGTITRSGIAFVDAPEEIANPSIGQAVVIGDETFAVREAGRLASAINSMRQRDMQELVDVVAENL